MVVNSDKVKQLLLLLFLLIACAALWWSTLKPAISPTNTTNNIVQPANNSDATETTIETIEVVDQNFWESRLKVSYSLGKEHGRGYVALKMKEYPNHHAVGLVTRTGTHSGIALLSRHTNQENSYKTKTILGQMYNPYKQDRSYFKETYDVKLSWPGESELAPYLNENANRFSSVKRVIVYRNIPDYVDFAKSLVSQGFSPIDITFHLAVCPSCTPSLIFGNDIPITTLQAVLQTLKKHNYPIDKIEYSTKESDAGKILIGQTPGENSKPLWSKVDKLLTKNITKDDFFKIIDFTQNTPEERAFVLHEKAKKILDYSFNSKNNRRKAKNMLNTAMELDPNYIPTYIEIARSIIKSDRKFSIWYPSDASKQAKQVLENALKIDPDYADTYVLLGYMQTTLHEYDDALDSYDKAQQLGTKNLWLNNNRATWYLHHNEVDKAMAQLEKLINASNDIPNNERSRYYGLLELVELYVEHEKLTEAKDLYQLIHEVFPQKHNSTIGDYVKYLLTHDEDIQHANELISMAEDNNCYCLPYIKSMYALSQAASVPDTDKATAIKHITRAQAYQTDFPAVVATLAEGTQGRKILDIVLANVLTMKEVEATGSTLAHALNASSDTLNFLLNHNADPNLLNKSGLTPLMMAVVQSHTNTVKVLLKYGGDPNLKNTDGINARIIAKEMNRKDLDQMFKTEAI